MFNTNQRPCLIGPRRLLVSTKYKKKYRVVCLLDFGEIYVVYAEYPLVGYKSWGVCDYK